LENREPDRADEPATLNLPLTNREMKAGKIEKRIKEKITSENLELFVKALA
jgi:hypothetical protein